GVLFSRIHEGPDPKIDRPLERSGQDDVLRGVDGQVDDGLLLAVAETFAPQRGAAGIEFNDEDVVLSLARQGRNAEIQTALKVPDGYDVSHLIDNNRGEALALGVAETLTPENVAVRVEFCDEDIVISGTREGEATDIKGTIETPSGRD